MKNLKYKWIWIVLFAICLLQPSKVWADFGTLKSAGQDIFSGLREIIYPASAVGIIAVCIGGFFGNINWKWLTAIIIGLVVISLCAGFVALFAPSGAENIPANVMTGA